MTPKPCAMALAQLSHSTEGEARGDVDELTQIV